MLLIILISAGAVIVMSIHQFRGQHAIRHAPQPRTTGWASATWTAVTLYSGQFVAQSEFSVVTTLAPDSG